MTDRAYTPPMLAERWGVAADRVRAMIVAGDLAAFNLAPAGQRPQYRIAAEAVARFERARSVAVSPPPPKRARIAHRHRPKSYV